MAVILVYCICSKFWCTKCVISIYVYSSVKKFFVYPKVLVDKKVTFYALHIGLLNKLLLLRQCVTCTTTRLPEDWCTVFMTCSI